MNLTKEIEYIEFLKDAGVAAESAGVKVYAVGGFVRDTFLKRKIKEIDFVVIGDGPNYAQMFADKLGVEHINIFRNFGTAHFRYGDYDLEFVGARKESYNRDSRKPDVEEGSFEDDLKRRDFTINTLAISVCNEDFGELIDMFNGLDDLENKFIKTPIAPNITFDDDPLRIMRAFRFASQLNFEVDPAIMEAAESLRERLKIVSQERITDEFLKILASDKPSIGLHLLYYSKVMEVIFPEIAHLGGVDQRDDHHHKDVFLHTCQVVDNIAEETNDVWLRLAALMHDIAKPQTKKFVEGTGWTFHGHEELGARMMKRIFKKMKFPYNKLPKIEKLVRLHLRPIALVDESVTDSAVRRLIVQAGEDLEDLITLCRADITSKNPKKVSRYLSNYDTVMAKVREVEEKDRLRAFQSPVKGDEIMKICEITPSKKVGEIKSAIEEAILDGKIKNTYEEALSFLLQIKDDILKQK